VTDQSLRSLYSSSIYKEIKKRETNHLVVNSPGISIERSVVDRGWSGLIPSVAKGSSFDRFTERRETKNNYGTDKEHFFLKYHFSQNDTCHLEVDPKPLIVEPYPSKLCPFDLNLIT